MRYHTTEADPVNGDGGGWGDTQNDWNVAREQREGGCLERGCLPSQDRELLQFLA